MVPVDAELVVVAASDGNELEAAELLAAVGLRVRGFLGGGMTAWRAEERPVERIEAIDLAELARRLDGGDGPLVLDVRNAAEFAAGHIPGSVHIPFAQLPRAPRRAPRERPMATICKAGKRSGLAASILQREGFEGVDPRLAGGVPAWRALGRELETAETPAA